MKYLITISFLLSMTFCSFGQGNLQFNRALFLTLDVNFVGQSVSPAAINTNNVLYDTLVLDIPTGKTVKVENISTSSWEYEVPSSDGCLPYVAIDTMDFLRIPRRYPNQIFLNGVMVSSYKFSYNAPAEVSEYKSPPIWMPAGRYVFTLVTRRDLVNPPYCASSSSYLLPKFKSKAFISAIEFNIIP